MANTMNERSARKSVPLTERDLADLAKLRSSDEDRQALARVARENLASDASEAAILHAVWSAGIRALKEQRQEAGYAAWAASMTDDEKAERRQIAWRRRVTEAWAADE